MPGPSFMDITSLGIAVDGDELAVTIGMAGDLADVLNTSPEPVFLLQVAPPGDGPTRLVLGEPRR